MKDRVQNKQPAWFNKDFQVALVVKKIHQPILKTQEMQVRPLGQDDPLKQEMATLYSVLAWKIPWTEEPGRLESMGPQTVGHNWATKHHTHDLKK